MRDGPKSLNELLIRFESGPDYKKQNKKKCSTIKINIYRFTKKSYIYHILKTKQKQAVMQTTNRPQNYTKLAYIQKVSRINRKLRLGDITKAAAITGYSNQHVSDVVSGRRFNSKIVNELYDMTRGRKSNVYKLSSLEA